MVQNSFRSLFAIIFAGCVVASAPSLSPASEPVEGAGETASAKISHRFIAFGKDTYIMEADGNKSWAYPASTRDGYALADGTVLLALSKSKKYPGGAAVTVNESGDEKLIWKGTQSEVNSAQLTSDCTFVLTEAGESPRLLEVDKDGKIVVEFALKCQKANHHMQSRMARKLLNGNYLVPHLLNFAVFEYDAKGNVVSKIDTTVPGDAEKKIHSWPFTAIRHHKGQTLVCCTNGNRVVDYAADGSIAWQLTNDDLDGEWLQDPCGGQVLPNGNVVITSYAGGRKDPNAPKLLEVTREKEVVWTYSDGLKSGIHHFQILDTDGTPLALPAMK